MLYWTGGGSRVVPRAPVTYRAALRSASVYDSNETTRGHARLRMAPATAAVHTTGEVPPSTLMAVPVIYEAASEARKQAMLANSWASPTRPSGTREPRLA